MDAFREFNLYSGRKGTQRVEEPHNSVPADMKKGYFQGYLRLLERRKLKLMQTADSHTCSEDISGISAHKTLKGCRYAIKEKNLSKPEEKEVNFQFKPYRKKENSEPIGALACALETESTGSGKECFKLRSPEARISRTSGGHTEPESSGIKKTVLLKEKNSDIETISAQELKKCMDSKIPLLILDVREESELFGKLGHLENSTNIPLGSLENRLKELEKERDLEIIVVCRSGVRASKAAKFLVRKGFKKVKVLKGGMLAWRDLQT